MGNTHLNSLLQSSTVSQQQIPWSPQFHLIDKEPLNNTYVLHHLPTSNFYKIKHLTLNKLHHSELFRQIDFRSTNPSPFVVKLDKVQQYTVKGYCSEHQEVFLMFKYVQNTLKEQILNRRFKKQRFTENEIRVILQAGIKGITYFHDIGCPLKALNTSQIIITSQRAVLVNDPLLSLGSILSHSIQPSLNQPSNAKNIFSIPQEEYPSPQKLLYQNDLIEQYNEWLSGFFTLGIILLETIFLEPLREVFYDKVHKKIYYHKVKQKIQDIRQGIHLEKDIAHLKREQSQKLTSTNKIYQQNSCQYSHQSSLINQIKQDLRRLLSHQPRIRESVHLKYKKNRSSYLCLQKSKDQFKQNLHFQNNTNLNPFTHTQVKEPAPFGGQNLQRIKYNGEHNFQLYGYNQPYRGESANNSRFNQYSKVIQQQAKKSVNKYDKKLNYFDELLSNEQNSNTGFRVVSSSLPNKEKLQSLNSKQSFIMPVMPVSSQYIIDNYFLNLNETKINKPNQIEKPVYHHLGKRISRSGKEQRSHQIELTNISHQIQNTHGNLVEMKNKPIFQTRKNTLHGDYFKKGELSPTKQILVEKQQQNTSLFQTRDNKSINFTPLSLSSHNYNYQSPSHTTSLYTLKPLQNINFLESNFSTTPTLNLSTNNITRSQSNYIQKININNYQTKKHEINLQPNTYLNQSTQNNMITQQAHAKYQPNFQPLIQHQTNLQARQPPKISLYQSSNKNLTYSNNNQTPTYIPSLFSTNLNYLSSLPLKTQSNSHFINFQEWKQNHNFQNMQGTHNQPSKNQHFTRLNNIPSSKQLTSYPFKQVGSINYDESHFLNDKESFVIDSYNGGLNRHNIPPRVATPISTLHSSNPQNISPKNSFQINHSVISNFRNDGKSFSSMDQDLKQFRKIGPLGENDKKTNSSYSSAQKVSVIDKIYDPEIMNSNNPKSFDNTPNKNDISGKFTHQRTSQGINDRQRNQNINKSYTNSSQNYLQTPERHPGKNKLNSTIRQASCQESGVNHSNSNNQSYQNQKIQPNTEVSKYHLLQDRAHSLSKPKANTPNHIELKIPQQSINPTNNNTLTQKILTSKALQHVQQPEAQHRVTLYADGSRYMGQTDQQGQSHGYGILYYPDGQIAYQGQWLHGNFNGHGKLLNPYPLQMTPNYDYKDLTRMDEHIKEFSGIFVSDVKHGKGILKMHNNEIYNGEFVEDLADGRGKFYCSNGNTVQGVWEKGILRIVL